MRICQIITTLELGGAETLLANFCNLHVQKHEVCVIYLKGEPIIQNMFDEKIHIKHIRISIKCAYEIRAFLKEWRPDIVHTHLGHADLIGLWAATGLRIKTFCTMHNIYFKWNWRDKIIFSLYTLYFNTIASKCQIVCISKVVQQHVLHTLKAKGKNTHLLYNGIPNLMNTWSKEDARKELKIEQDKFVVLFIGRLEKQKAVHVLIESLLLIKKQISNLQVEIIGTGSLQAQLENQVDNLGINGLVNFRGNTLDTQVYYSSADIFVLPSIFEGLGIVLLEAFRASLPVVASNIEGPKELIDEGENGLLFPSGNPSYLAESILKLYNSPEMRNKIGQEANFRFQGKFKIQHYADKLEELYLQNT